MVSPTPAQISYYFQLRKRLGLPFIDISFVKDIDKKVLAKIIEDYKCLIQNSGK